jgi:pimeloyl-ACP methyl ester carboxylesterase
MHSAMWVTANGAELYVEIAGEGTTVFCVHTAGQSGVQYRRLVQELPALGYRVVVIDLPGHGRSRPAPGGPVQDLHEYAEFCWAAMVELEIVAPFVVGCSIGGKIALDLCVHHGGEIAGAVAMEADAYNGALSVSGLRRSMSDPASPSQGDRTFFGTLASLGMNVDDQRAHEIALMHRREDNVITASDLIGWTTHDLRSDLRFISCPVLVIAGSDDFWIRPGWVRECAEMIPLGEYRQLEGVGHYPMEEIEGFASLLVRWLEELAARDPHEGMREGNTHG